MTLDTYADLFDDDLDAVAARLNAQMPLVALPAGPQTRYVLPTRPPRADCSISVEPEPHETRQFGVLGRRMKRSDGLCFHSQRLQMRAKSGQNAF
jgi:hypothetical protein